MSLPAPQDYLKRSEAAGIFPAVFCWPTLSPEYYSDHIANSQIWINALLVFATFVGVVIPELFADAVQHARDVDYI